MQAGVKWDICRVQCILQLSRLRVHRHVVRYALNMMHLEHMEQRQLGWLRREQYTIMKPMILWHVDYETFVIYVFALYILF